MVEKMFDKMESIQHMNETAAMLKQLGMNEKLKKLAEENQISDSDLEAYLKGKRYCLVDGGSTKKSYISARSKILDEMLYLKDPTFADVVGNHLLKQCNNPELEQHILRKHKTLQRCINYLMEKAWEIVDEEAKKQRTQVGFAVESDTVFGWVKDYYELDDAAQVAEKEKEVEEKFIKQISAAKEVKKPVSKKSTAKKPGQNQTKKNYTDVKNEKTTIGNDGKEGNKEGEQLSLFGVGMTT